jgi:UDP-N-acetyl-D-mannosaminuronic acid dehydrogenase
MRLCVHGLGYVGLATASLFANDGHEVVGYDTDPAVVTRLQQGRPDVTEDELASFVRRALAGGLEVSETPVAAEYHLLCVPTPHSDGANLEYVEQAAGTIASQLRPGDTVVVESTVPPGTTVSVVKPLLERAGRTAGADFSLAYTPETILPGNTVPELRSNDRIIGGFDDDATRAVRSLYEPTIDGEIHTAPDPTTAEFVKLAQNASRDVNIAFANELALLADDYDVDVRESIELANTHPRVEVLRPGPGVGGHCLPVDPLFLGEDSDRTTLVDAAREVNDGMTDHIVDRLREELGSLADRRIAVLGVAYKGNVGETRHSPGLALAGALEAATVVSAPLADGGSGTVDVTLTDPHVTDEDLDLCSLADTLQDADAAVVTAAHDEYAALDPNWVADLVRTPVVFDTVAVLDEAVWRDAGVSVLAL